MQLNLNKKKFLSEENVAQIVKIGINFGERLNSIESEIIADYDNTKTYLKGESCYHNNYIYRCKATATGDWDFSRWELIGDEITELTKDDIKDMLGLSDEELETLSKIILDSEVRLDKTYSSSKIYTDIQNAIDTAKAYTLTELGKISGASYKVVSSTSDMTDEKVIYLLQNGLNYDIYIVDSGTPTKIGDTNIDLSGYLKIDDANNIYLKKTDATSTYATKIEINDKVDKTSIKTAISTTPSNDNVLSEKYIDENIVKKNDISTTIDDTSTDDTVPTNKAVYDNAIKDKNIKTYTRLEQIGLTSGCTVEEIYSALPKDSYFECGTNTTYDNSPLYVINNLPNQYGGLLVIRKASKNVRNTIEYRTTNGQGIMTDLYIAQFKGIDLSGLTWKRVCTTKVEDVSRTFMPLPDGNSGELSYIIKNGFATITVFNLAIATSPLVVTGLPIPATYVANPVVGVDGMNVGGSICYSYNDEFVIYGTPGIGMYGVVTYPVSES